MNNATTTSAAATATTATTGTHKASIEEETMIRRLEKGATPHFLRHLENAVGELERSIEQTPEFLREEGEHAKRRAETLGQLRGEAEWLRAHIQGVRERSRKKGYAKPNSRKGNREKVPTQDLSLLARDSAPHGGADATLDLLQIFLEDRVAENPTLTLGRLELYGAFAEWHFMRCRGSRPPSYDAIVALSVSDRALGPYTDPKGWIGKTLRY